MHDRGESWAGGVNNYPEGGGGSIIVVPAGEIVIYALIPLEMEDELGV